MARNSPLALSRRAASLLVYLGAPLVLLTGCTQGLFGRGMDVFKCVEDLLPQRTYVIYLWAIIPCADPAVWISSVHDPHVELSLHCIDYVVETTPTSLSHRVLNLVHSLQFMQSKLLWIKKCLSIEDGGCLTPRILTVLISSVGREQSTQHFVGTLLLLSTQSATLKTYMGLQFSLTNRYLSCRIHDATRQWEPQIVWASCITNIWFNTRCIHSTHWRLLIPQLSSVLGLRKGFDVELSQRSGDITTPSSPHWFVQFSFQIK